MQLNPGKRWKTNERDSGNLVQPDTALTPGILQKRNLLWCTSGVPKVLPVDTRSMAEVPLERSGEMALVEESCV
jgi:hypothetical protein